MHGRCTPLREERVGTAVIGRRGPYNGMVVSARGFVFVAVLFVSSLLYSVTLLTPALLLLIPISPPGVYLCFRRAYRRWSGFVGYLFFAMAAFLLENFCGIKVRTCANKPAIVVVEAHVVSVGLGKVQVPVWGGVQGITTRVCGISQSRVHNELRLAVYSLTAHHQPLIVCKINLFVRATDKKDVTDSRRHLPPVSKVQICGQIADLLARFVSAVKSGKSILPLHMRVYAYTNSCAISLPLFGMRERRKLLQHDSIFLTAELSEFFLVAGPR